MAAAQELLFPDPQPLVERLGREFFRQLPERPGVYLMRDESDAILYIGKAKNLRQRLASYRSANPDRVPRRRLRLLNAVARIELLECADEAAALARESEMLRAIRPRFNRAGTWASAPRYLAWRCVQGKLSLAVTAVPVPFWHTQGPLGWRAGMLQAVLARLLWIAANPGRDLAALPHGWSREVPVTPAIIHCGERGGCIAGKLQELFAGEVAEFSAWFCALLPGALHPFHKSSIEADLEMLAEIRPLKAVPALREMELVSQFAFLSNANNA